MGTSTTSPVQGEVLDPQISSGTLPPVPHAPAACDMPRKELGMAGCNSGSCDSMVSTASNHSQCSDNSYDYLSVEEKEGLMFLEETIGSLDAEADSGVSTDDTDYVEPSKLPGTWRKRDSAAPVEDPVPADKSSQEMPKEDRLDQANTRRQVKSLGSLIIQPPDPFQDDLVSHEWSRSNRSDDKKETAKETNTWTSWGQPEQSVVEEAPQDPDTKRGPPTAPKPRKLPPNIILKTSKTSPVPLATEPGQKVRATPPSSASSQPGSASDIAAERANLGHPDPKDREKAHREALEKLGLSQDRREPSAHLPPQPRGMPGPGQPEARRGAAPGTRHITFKSNTLERSGVGLGSSMASAKEQNAKTSTHPLQSCPRAPRPCVSVKISPKGTAEENRREALKKLGLLKE
ncbi:PREDICTED: specifically androgen-regulated gene protein [Merops nubicus]|uniref:specifically androgen-regulated gene protein n=1 Tax=Merops nubicus TaxID=57421 RepID=UPI0004F027B5|nr:PREDICTED: specifically androgen-regulated gene protein [Merops nubicus]